MDQALLETLFAYDRWSTRALIEECAKLTQEEFERTIGIGPGSVERTVNHLVGAMFFFADRLNRRTPRPRLEKDGRIKTAADLLILFDQADRDFGEAVTRTITAHAMTDLFNWTDTDEGPIDPDNQIPYALAFSQMIDHGIQHRTQVADMLELLGKGLPTAISPFVWDNTVRAEHS